MHERCFLTKKDLLWLIAAVVYNFSIYNLGRYLSGAGVHADLSTALDHAIPFVPWMILIYWGCYLYWIANYCLGVAWDERGERRMILAHFIGETVCFLTFVLYPTTMVRPQITGDDIWCRLVALTYAVDAADNLLPSIHCFVSWLCWIGVRGNRRIPRWYQAASLVMTVAVCVSTLTVKQHVIADVAAGIILAEVSWLCAGTIGGCRHRAGLGKIKKER